MSNLKARDPVTTEPRKPQIVIYGAPGVGKTWFALSFPAVYYIDTEGGASRSHYMARLKASGGSYLGPEDGANDFDFIIGQVKALATEQHNYRTLVIDSITKPFLTAVSQEAERLGAKDAFGASKKPAVGAIQRIVRAIGRMDMNVVFVAHEKGEWGMGPNGDRVEIGRCADVHDKMIYDLDLALHVTKRGPARFAAVRKSRLIGFPESDSFELDYESFAARYGKDVIERVGAVLKLATEKQVIEINRLVELLKVDSLTVEKWLDKAQADTLAELNTDQADKIIKSLKAKIA